MHFSKQITAIYNTPHPHAGSLRKKGPQARATKKGDGKSRGSIGKLQKTNKHDVHNREQHQRLKNRPRHPKKRSLVTELKIGFHQLLEHNYRVAILVPQPLHKLTHNPYMITSSRHNSCSWRTSPQDLV